MQAIKPLFRYPGGKYKLRHPILAELLRLTHTHDCYEYREPFFGGGAVGINLLAQLKAGATVWINDRDYSLAVIWDCVMNYPDDFKEFIHKYVPSVESFFQFRSDLTKGLRMKREHFHWGETCADFALRKLAVHQMSYSGLGTMAGGPLGGKNQSSPYGIDSRWSPSRLTRRIDDLHRLFSRFDIRSNTCTSDDFASILYGTKPALVYLDPPYFQKGAICYEHAFSPDDHRRLATVLRSAPHHWVLSYDDCPEIYQLYSWARIQEIPVTYSIGKGGTQKTELLITRE
jgi:DNA adenine methylase